MRRSRRISEATETDRISVENEVEPHVDVDTVMEETEHDQPLSPVNDESSAQRLEGIAVELLRNIG